MPHTDHICGCRACDPALPKGPRCCSKHAGVRLSGIDGPLFEVYRDGQRPRAVTEAHAGSGNSGWTVEVRLPAHACTWCDSDLPCERIYHGDVELLPTDPELYYVWESCVNQELAGQGARH